MNVEIDSKDSPEKIRVKERDDGNVDIVVIAGNGVVDEFITVLEGEREAFREAVNEVL